MTYPSDFPLTDVKNIVTTAKAGTFKEDLQQFAKSIWNVQGYAQLHLIGEPGSDPAPAPQTALAKTPEDAIAALEQLVESHENGEVSAQDLSEWAWMITWAMEQLITLIKEYFWSEGESA
jgi:hypothetical protein